MVYVIQVCWLFASRIRTEPVPPWSCSLCVQCVYNEEFLMPKHVEFYSKNKFEKLVHLVGFSIRISLTLCPLIYIHHTVMPSHHFINIPFVTTCWHAKRGLWKACLCSFTAAEVTTLKKLLNAAITLPVMFFYNTPINLKVLIKRFSTLSVARDNFTFTTSGITKVTYTCSWKLQRSCVSNPLQFICIFHIIHSDHCELNYKLYQHQQIR
jgi:hypothetical protein